MITRASRHYCACVMNVSPASLKRIRALPPDFSEAPWGPDGQCLRLHVNVVPAAAAATPRQVQKPSPSPATPSIYGA